MYFSRYIFYICMYIDDYLIIVTFFGCVFSSKYSSFKSQVVNNSSQQQPATTTDPHGDGKKVFRGVFQHPAFTKDNYEGA